MSVDIDWSLLSLPSLSGPSLSDRLIVALNTAFNNASRPSFLGPVTVTTFDFGDAGPDVEIKDVRDVWRAFDEGDDEGDAILQAREEEERRSQFDQLEQNQTFPPYSPPLSVQSGYIPGHEGPGGHGHRFGHGGRPASLSISGPLNGLSLPHGGGPGLAGAAALATGPFGRRPRMSRATPSAPVTTAHAPLHGDPDDDDEPLDPRVDEDAGSVHSGLFSGRHSVASVGIGLGGLGLRGNGLSFLSQGRLEHHHGMRPRTSASASPLCPLPPRRLRRRQPAQPDCQNSARIRFRAFRSTSASSTRPISVSRSTRRCR